MDNEKIPFKMKLSYGIGALGKDMVYSIVATWLMFYLTDIIGIAPAFLGIFFLITRIWDAINDPMMGMVIDNTHSRWGRFRPWLLIGTLINSVILIFLFTNPGISTTGTKVYFCIFYVLWGMSYTIMDIPYWSLIPALSSNKEERDKISVIPRVFAAFGFITVAAGGLPFVKMAGKFLTIENYPDYLPKLSIDFLNKPTQEKGFLVLAIVIAIIFIITELITIINVKEKTPTESSVKLKDLVKTIVNNDQAIVVLVTIVVFNTVIFLTQGLGIYFFKYAMANEDLFTSFTAVAGVAQVLAMLLFPLLSKKISHKSIFRLAIIIPIIGYLSLFIAGILLPNQIPLLLGAIAILFFGLGLFMVLSTVMLANVVDYGEWKLKKRNEGIIFSMQPFTVKVATGVSALIIGVGLQLIGFKANQVQTLFAINGIRIMMFIVPLFGLVISWYIFNRFYKIDEEFYEEINTELDIRNKKREGEIKDDFSTKR